MVSYALSTSGFDTFWCFSHNSLSPNLTIFCIFFIKQFDFDFPSSDPSHMLGVAAMSSKNPSKIEKLKFSK